MERSWIGRVFAPTAWLAALVASLAATQTARADDAPEKKPLEVEARSERAPVAARDPSGASFVIREERLRAPGASAADALGEVPGVEIARTGAGSDLALARVRGATSAETPVYLAGVRLNDDVTGTADLSLVPLWMVHRVEVYRSGAPLDADRFEPGGAIFFEPVLPRGPRLGGGLGAGSFGEVSAWTAGGTGSDRASALFAIRRQSAQNEYPYLDPTDGVARVRRNADYAAWDAWTIARVTAGRASVTAIANAFTREQGLSGFVYVPAQRARANVRRFLGAVTAAVPCARDDRCRLELRTAALAGESDIRDPLREFALRSTYLASASARIEEDARLRLHLGDTLTLGASLSQAIAHLGIDAPGEALLRARRSTSRAAVSALWAIAPGVDLDAIASIEGHATTAAGDGGSGAGSVVQPTARLGARYRAPIEGRVSLTLLANAGRYARVPTLGELYGTSAIVRGNPDLAPETGLSTDLGARVEITAGPASLFADAFGFLRVASDLIGYRRTSFDTIRPFNVANARVLGAELAAGAVLFQHVEATVSLTALDPRDTSNMRAGTSDVIPSLPRFTVIPALGVKSGALPVISLDRASLTARLSYRAAYAVDPAGAVNLPAQAPIDLEAALHFLRGRVAARFAVNDVLDIQRFDLIGLPLPRRSAHGSLEVWW
jgi:iron complex outermembrane receptor protein